MGNENNTASIVTHPMHNLEQLLTALLTERRCCLIDHQHLRIEIR